VYVYVHKEAFCKTTDEACAYGYFIRTYTELCIDFDKNGLGDILGDFFAKSSGHPGRNAFNAAAANL
jgi:hypothetical protein